MKTTSAASLHANGITVVHGQTLILDEVALVLIPGRRLGLVGPNGVGKSTLLRVLAGELVPTAGTVEIRPGTATVGLSRQEPERRAGETVRHFLHRRTGVADAQAALDQTTQQLAAGVSGADDRYSDALERWLSLGAPDLDARIAETWADLGLREAVLESDMTVLSGGEAARAGLAALLLSRFDVLLLDEPTNDLDHDGLDRLERFAQTTTTAIALVSHDRAFLERTITDVVEIDEHTRRATGYGGGWASYLAERDIARQHSTERYETFARQRDQLRARAQREREWSTQGVKKAKRQASDGDKHIRNFKSQTSEQLAAKAGRTERAIERLGTIEEPRESWELRFTIAEAERSGDIVAMAAGATVDGRLGPIDLTIGYGEKIALVGPNGAGKSTLINTLLGRVTLDAGVVRLGGGVVVGELDQARAALSQSRPLLDAFLDTTGMTVPDARTLLAKFSIDAQRVLRPSNTLSPGERTRALMAVLAAVPVNLLVLDEPTNHLDLPAIEQLESALDRFGGTLVLVSHDRRLLESVGLSRIVRLEGGLVVADGPPD